ncbi:MAG TPA: hypothetical protein VL025_18630, partial [Thermoanaerobaculia bacterium]|nr:hypothetical protein [Thermoanaerobaculia bacterium]
SFRKRCIDLSAGDAVPISQPPLKKLFGDDLSSHPQSRSESPDRIPHLGLLPEDLAGFEVRLDARAADQSCPLIDLEHQVLATGIPNRSEDEFHRERLGEDGLDLLFHYGPRNSDVQRERLVRMLVRAAEEGATVLVLPELCADEECLSALTEAFQAARPSLRLLVAGSRHVRDSGGLRNECVALLRGYRHPLTHSKFASYVLRRQGQPALREGLLPARRLLTLFVCDDWSFTFLICKDFLDPDVDHLLRQLGVSLLFVPALTPRTGEFAAFSTALAYANQALVVVANNPIFPTGDPVHSIFSFPRRSRAQRVAGSRECPPPGVCLYRLMEDSMSWVDVVDTSSIVD